MITVNLYYKGINGNARAFVDEMESSGIADAIRAEEGNLRYEYFQPLKDPETVLLIRFIFFANKSFYCHVKIILIAKLGKLLHHR